MTKLINGLLVARSSRLNGLFAFAIVGAIALGCTCNRFGDVGNTSSSNSDIATNSTVDSPPSKPDASTGEVPTPVQVQELARTTVLDFNDAIQQGDFSDFHRTVSKSFQKTASPQKMKNAFKVFIDAKVNFKEIRDLTAVLLPAPAIETSFGVKNLRVKGYYPTSPRRLNFDLKYIPEGEDWKLISIEINTKDQ